MTKKISRALISVSDKTGIVDFAKTLIASGVTIISTGGTAKALSENGIDVVGVSDITGFPEIMGGRVKTLHPKIHGGILGRRDVDGDVMHQHNIDAIDLVVVNLYPFQETVAQPDCSLAAAIENIDIGGPAMIRAAAKNHADVAVLTDPADYVETAESIAGGGLSSEERYKLACKAFSHTAQYDSAVACYLGAQVNGGQKSESTFEPSITLELKKIQDLRYGENPHQTAAFYKTSENISLSIGSANQLQGKELSFNNIADADAAMRCVHQFESCACVIVKHANPCGVAVAEDCRAGYEAAYKTDPVSAFGGIIAFNRELDGETAALIVERQFVEVLIAPSYTPQALEALAQKPNVRVLQLHGETSDQALLDYRYVSGGMLVQDLDQKRVTADDLKIVTKVEPTVDQIRDLLFAFQVVKAVKSNAIVFCKDNATLGVGAGQMSRVYSAKIAAIKAQDAELEIKGSVLASDAFFPFRDTVEQAAEYGVSAIIQPGGSMRDDEVIAAADELGIAMVFTGVRHFYH